MTIPQDDHTLVQNPIAKGQILIVASSYGELISSSSGKQRRTGADMWEIAQPYVTWKSNGFDCTIASPKGGEVPIDEESMKLATSNNAPPEVHRFLRNDAAMQQLKHSVPLERVEKLTGVYSAIYIPGGHGAAFDLPSDKKLMSLLAEANVNNIVMAAICHGPAAFVDVPEKPDGTEGYMVKRRRMTCYSDAEERASGMDAAVPFLVESKLRERGADMAPGPPGSETAVADGLLITGQNPYSAFKMATMVLEALTANWPEDEKKTGTGAAAQFLGTNPPQQMMSEQGPRLR